MDAGKLYRQLMKGAAYFNKQYAEGNRHPLVKKQVAEFERQVIAPFDAACLKMTKAERDRMEADYVPF